MSYKRIVIKVGSHVLTEDGGVAKERMLNLVELIADVMQQGKEVILVSSGAVAAGFSLLALDRKNVANKQVLAAIGQPLLLKMYQEKFATHDILCSQVLLSADDMDSKKRTALGKSAIDMLLAHKVVPIINENDVIAIEELVFGDNDQLAASVTCNFEADLLVILSDIDAYYDKDPHQFEDAKALKEVSFIPKEDLDAEFTANHEFATGGIVTKLKAANFLLERNTKMFMATGFDLSDVKSFLLDGVHVGGTLFKKF